MEAPGAVNIVSRALMNSFGTLFNVILIFMVFNKTTKPLRTYSILVLTTAVCDLIACASSLLHNERIMLIGVSNFLISYGTCCKLGSLTCGITLVLLSLSANMYV
ncbi:unnamed protein product [Cylicocyclus nassatus]|uniref:G-protein coupled receptors family 1 profile domain-containing protein n=1 Tax=Cylicocyclus nassatus TaxID=53992 RepID=A0AA36GTQ3_CYLNA|nr:unnamed protein product [Cylicocyclus nassatus]